VLSVIQATSLAVVLPVFPVELPTVHLAKLLLLMYAHLVYQAL